MTDLTPLPGRCAHCQRRRDVYRIGRSGGGTYRRGGRQYWSSICLDCAKSLLTYLGSHAGATASGFDGSALRRIVGGGDG